MLENFENASGGLIKYELETEVVYQRKEDGYLNATAMCKAGGKLYADYGRLKVTSEYLSELSRSMGIPIDLLVTSTTTGKNELRGTWVHPRVATHLAQWLSPKFAVQVSEWLDAWMKGQLSPTPAPTYDLSTESGQLVYLSQVLAENNKAMAIANQIIFKDKQRIAELEPKAEFYDQIGSSKTNLSVGQAAKALGTGEYRLFTYLRQIKWVQKISNEPYQAKIEAGYLATKISRWTDERTGEPRHRLVTLVTGKGLQKLKRMLDGGSELLELPAA